MEFDLSLYLVTDRELSLGRSLYGVVEEAIAGGVSMVQLREKNFSDEDFLRTALRMKKILSSSGVPLIINDNVEVALKSNAEGVHIGQSDMAYEDARKLLGRDKIIGLSVETMAQVEEANLLDVDYIGISPVFTTPTKTDTEEPFGLSGVSLVSKISKHRTVAIGGINRDNAGAVIKAGAHGIAVVSAICSAPSPMKAARELQNIVHGALAE